MMKTVFIITFHASANKAGTLAQKLKGEDEAQGGEIQIRKVPTAEKVLAHALPRLCGRSCLCLERFEGPFTGPVFNSHFAVSFLMSGCLSSYIQDGHKFILV